jgi:isopentenyl-diphosphate Delta-isomerase
MSAKKRENIVREEESSVTDSRKADHIQMAFEAIGDSHDSRFFYEPLFSELDEANIDLSCSIGEKKVQFPLWISSMTGGSHKVKAKTINERLAIAAKDYGLGMGLGSCRSILNDDFYFQDFNLRGIIGNDCPLYANLGIAQLNELYINKSFKLIDSLVSRLKADGVIIHINPLQELFQPEGDRYDNKPTVLLNSLKEHIGNRYCFIIKEVGQGFGPESLRFLFSLEPTAIELAGFGGTNFAKLESLRLNEKSSLEPLIKVGNTLDEMIDFLPSNRNPATSIIASGGVTNFLDGYYCTQKTGPNTLYGQASLLLKRALVSQDELNNYIESEIKGFTIAKKFLTVK